MKFLGMSKSAANMCLHRNKNLDDTGCVEQLKHQQLNQNEGGCLMSENEMSSGKEIWAHSSDLVEVIFMKTSTVTVFSIRMEYDNIILNCSHQQSQRMQS